MNIARTLTLALATCLSTFSAMASPEGASFISGHATWQMSQDFLYLVSALPPTKVKTDATVNGVSNTASYDKPTQTINLAFSQAKASEGPVSFLASGSLVQFNFRRFDYVSDFSEEMALADLTVSLKNLEVNFGDSSIRADLSTSYTLGSADAIVTSFGRMAIFQSDVPGISTGTQGLVVSGQAAGNFAGELRLTDAARNIVVEGLYGTPGQPLSPVALMVVAPMSWGTISAQGTFTSPVPEPATWALMLVSALPLLAARRCSHFTPARAPAG